MALPIHGVTLPKSLSGQQNGQIPDNLLVDTPGQGGGPVVRLVTPADRAWRAMCAAAVVAGFVFRATSIADSYRSYEIQKSTFQQRFVTYDTGSGYSVTWEGRTWWLRKGQAPAAVPGTSNHGWGLAVDIQLPNGSISSAAVAWLTAYAYLYGFSAETQLEDWHWRYYTGDSIPAAVLDYEKGNGMTDSKETQATNTRNEALATGVLTYKTAWAANANGTETHWLGTKVQEIDDKLDTVLAALAAAGLVPHTHPVSLTGSVSLTGGMSLSGTSGPSTPVTPPADPPAGN